jgi:hypothetical protein
MRGQAPGQGLCVCQGELGRRVGVRPLQHGLHHERACMGVWAAGGLGHGAGRRGGAVGAKTEAVPGRRASTLCFPRHQRARGGGDGRDEQKGDGVRGSASISVFGESGALAIPKLKVILSKPHILYLVENCES